MTNNFARRIILKNMYYVRDLGGMPTYDGKLTKYGVYIASEYPSLLSCEELDILYQVGIRNCINLHGVCNYTHSLVMDKRFNCIDIPYLYHKMQISRNIPMYYSDSDWANIYIDILENQKAWISRVFTTLETLEEGTLIHCRTGKGRTSIITMLIMMLVNVIEEDIISDYANISIYMREKYKQLIEIENKDPSFYRSDATIMIKTINHILTIYDNVENYLLSCNIPHKVIDKIKKKLI